MFPKGLKKHYMAVLFFGIFREVAQIDRLRSTESRFRGTPASSVSAYCLARLCGSEFQALRFRVCGLGCRVQGFGVRVEE